MSDATESCVAFAFGWVLGWGSGAVRAAVAMKGWEWFVADTFGAPELAFVEAWGFFTLVSFAVLQLQGARPHERDVRPFVVMAQGILTSLFLSGFVFLSLLILAGLR